MRVCCEYQAYIEPYVTRITRALLNRQGDPYSDESTYAMHMIAGEARTIEGRLSKGPWIVGENPGAVGLHDLSRASSCCCARSRCRKRASCRRAFCRWKRTIRR